MTLKEWVAAERQRWKGLSAYPKFEHAVILVLSALIAIVVALGLVSMLGLAFDLSFFITNMITMIGLAVGIDYSLFIVSRYREELRSGHDPRQAVTRTVQTAGRTVGFSALVAVFGALGAGGLFSVALSRGSPRVAVGHHPALRSPDFPRPSTRQITSTCSPLTPYISSCMFTVVHT